MATAVQERDDLILALADDVDEALRLTLAYTVELDTVAAQIGAAVRQVFEDLARTDRDDIAAFITDAEPYVLAGIDEGADLAAAYMSEMTGTTLAATDIVLPDIAYDDPFLRTWHQISEGYEYGAAKESGASVADMLGYDATTDGAARRMGANRALGIRGWSRVISAKACEWCRVVSTQMYKSQKTATFGHHGCRCYVIPVFEANADAVKAINKARLADLRKEGAVAKATESRIRSKERERFAQALL